MNANIDDVILHELLPPLDIEDDARRMAIQIKVAVSNFNPNLCDGDRGGPIADGLEIHGLGSNEPLIDFACQLGSL